MIKDLDSAIRDIPKCEGWLGHPTMYTKHNKNLYFFMQVTVSFSKLFPSLVSFSKPPSEGWHPRSEIEVSHAKLTLFDDSKV